MELVRVELLERSERGVAKYQTTLARTDLGRPPAEAHERPAWLRKNKPELVAELWVEKGEENESALS